jgi:hypothetical protein
VAQQASQQTARREERGRLGQEEAAAERRSDSARPSSAAKVDTAKPAEHAAPPAPARPAASAQLQARDLATSAQLRRAAGGAEPTRERTEQKSARNSHASEGTPAAPLPQQPAALSSEPSSRPSSLPQPAARAAELPQAVLGAILPNGADLKLQSDTLGELSLHLRVRDGVAHLRVEGEQAAQVVGHGQELQRALAAEGLKLGRLEVDRPAVPVAPHGEATRFAADQGAPQGQRDRPEQGAPGAGSRTATATPQRRPSGRASAHHVEA